MAVLGIGIDLVEIERIDRAISHPRYGQRFRRRVFTRAEQLYCEGQSRPAASFAVRFAAKEAVIKALGPSGTRGLPWRAIEVSRPGPGAPEVLLHGRVAAAAQALGVKRIHLSLSHEAGLATAQALLED